jgi:hypothetical protein
MPDQIDPTALRDRLSKLTGSPASPDVGAPDRDKLWESLQKMAASPKQKEQPSTDIGSSLWEGLKQGVTETGQGVAQLAARMPTMLPGAEAGRQRMQQNIDQSAQQGQQRFAQNPAVQAHPNFAEAGRIGGNMAATAPLAAVPGGAMGAMGRGLPSAAGLIARGAGAGAAGAATQPATSPDFWGEKFKQVGMGAAAGAALPAAGGMLSPHLPSPDVITSGVSRAFRPLMNFLTGAEERTIEGFDRTFARQVLEPIGGNIQGRPSGWKLNQAVEDQISKAYDGILPNIQVSYQGLSTPSQGMTRALATLNADEAKVYGKVVETALPEDLATRGSPLTGEEFRKARTAISGQAYKWFGTNKQDIGEALIETARHMTDVVSQENPQYAAPLQAAGEAYKLWMRMAAAAESSATSGGKFSPADALRAIKTQEPSGTGFATGDSVLQGYAQAAHQALGGDKTATIRDLVNVFARRGLPAQLYEQLAGPAGRGAKAATPYAAPAAGAFAGRQEDRQQPPRRSSLTEAPDRDPHVSVSGP